MSTSPKQIDQLFQSQLYLYFHEDILSTQRTQNECAFIEKVCGIPVEANILDLACGHGRHSNYFASKGYQVTGVDRNVDFLKLAKADAQEQGIQVVYSELDILQLNSRDQYDTVLLLFNTLGFFNRKDSKHLLEKIYQALKPGGKAFVDIKNRDHIIQEIRGCSIVEKGEDLMIDRLSFDPQTGTTTNNRIYIKEGQRYDTPFTMTCYNYTDMSLLTEEIGFEMDQVYGDWNGGAFDQQSRRIIMILGK